MLSSKNILRISFVGLSVLSSYVLTTVLKQLFAVPRPENIYGLVDFSFPSAHTSISTALFISLYLAFSGSIKNKFLKEVFHIICIVLPIGIGISRVIIGVHWISDVFFGWFVGFLCVAMSYYLICISYGYSWNTGDKTHKTNKRKR